MADYKPIKQTKKEVNNMTREEALKKAKLQMVMSGAGDKWIKALPGGYWANAETGVQVTQEEGLALIPDEAIDELYIRELMAEEA